MKLRIVVLKPWQQKLPRFFHKFFRGELLCELDEDNCVTMDSKYVKEGNKIEISYSLGDNSK